jgi:carboxypeptidase C (cathepsin A)
MTAYFGAALAKAIAAKSIVVNFKGVEIGDGWVDPIDCMYSYGPYLETFSQISPAQAENITQYAEFAQNALEEGNGTEATNWWSFQQNLIGLATGGINWYNSLYYYDYTADNQLDEFLGSNFTTMLGSIVPPNVSYNAQSGLVFNFMGGDFMNDGISQVDEILAAGYEVNILTGQVDLIVDVVCMQSWVKKLMWPDLPAFWQAPRNSITVPGAQNVGGFVQQYKNLRIWQVNLAGHMVPLDNPPVAEMMMASIVGDDVSGIKATPNSYEKHPSGKPVVHMHRTRY